MFADEDTAGHGRYRGKQAWRKAGVMMLKNKQSIELEEKKWHENPEAKPSKQTHAQNLRN